MTCVINDGTHTNSSDDMTGTDMDGGMDMGTVTDMAERLMAAPVTLHRSSAVMPVTALTLTGETLMPRPRHSEWGTDYDS